MFYMADEVSRTNSSLNKPIRGRNKTTVKPLAKAKTLKKESTAKSKIPPISKGNGKAKSAKISPTKKTTVKVKKVVRKIIKNSDTASTDRLDAKRNSKKKTTVKSENKPKLQKSEPKVSVKLKTVTKPKVAKKTVTNSKTASKKSAVTKSAPKNIAVKKTVVKTRTSKKLKPGTITTTKRRVAAKKSDIESKSARVPKSGPTALIKKVAKSNSNKKTENRKISKSNISKITQPKVIKPKIVKKTIEKKTVSGNKSVKVVKKPGASTRTRNISTAKLLTTKEKLKKLIAEAAAKKIELQKKKRIRIKKSTQKPKVEAIPNNDRKKPVRAVTSAVFRGKKSAYDFKVYEIGENLGSIPAVFVISKRTTDRNKRGHHSLVCIGETESVANELKIHRKSKCLKQNEANVISILPIENERERRQIAEDLKAAHSFVCNQQ